jgi:hypothetical protein
MSITLQNRFEPYLLDSDDSFSINCWLLLYLSFFGALVQQLVPGNDWIVYTVIGLNAVFIADFIIPFVLEAFSSVLALLFGVAAKLTSNKPRIVELKNKISEFIEKMVSTFLNQIL